MSFSSAFYDLKKKTVDGKSTASPDLEIKERTHERSLSSERTRRNTISDSGLKKLVDISSITVHITESEMPSVLKLQSVCKTFVAKKGYDIDTLEMRFEAIKELYETEVSFHQKMILLNTHFRIPFMQMKDQNTIPSRSFDRVFLTLEDLVMCSKMFIDKLEPVITHYSYNAALGPLMEGLLANVWPYIRFSIDYNIAQTELKFLKTYPCVLKLLREKSNEPTLENQAIEGLLIQPVQRIMRYPIILKQILKMTPKSHNDYKSLFEANADYTFFIHEVNERAKRRDKLVEVSQILNDANLIQPWRYFLKESKLSVNGKHRVVYLLNDLACWDDIKFLLDNKVKVETPKPTTVVLTRIHDTLTLKFEDEKEAKDWNLAFTDIIKNNKWKTNNEKNWFENLCKFKDTWRNI
ncbi:Rho/RAC guanine nucleotide exchange factor, putative [Entamoeba invadens IP1]|uniref:Rho/RAC guanine nucleotide exchange factor, putative n=1 Tax=Entamoeba invadens IP1 TaxID=370355 RepID=L7FM12_ENTIV|nr:Rho/RAC guanine nucleotide exchange factor, putative [Entamoeba invadens IP1]ELP84903.1 Rho/RAC guanine nucleotide exchange factor, putative [Entamoeba invadens IP1]|eukprot:XP_004184249.1 Rho/RAC guanine nucleotide exchange factor, putative [Entamoeba invadens IP1]